MTGSTRKRAGADIQRLIVDGEELMVISVPIHPEAAPETLSDGERDVLRMMLEGKKNADIARARGTAVRTVTNQVASIYRKLRIGSRSELAAWAARVWAT